MVKRIKSVIFCLFLISFFIFGFASAEVPEIKSMIAEVIFLQGSDYEMGYQYGQQRVEDFSKRTNPLSMDEYRAVMAYQYYIRLRTP